MKRTALIMCTAVLALASACGGDTGAPFAPGVSSPPDTSSGSSPVSPPTTETPDPAYVVLDQDELDGALLAIQDLPVGYSQDAPSESGDKTFCDYVPPFEVSTTASRDFIKGGGLSSELVSITLRQYGSADQARASFDALTEALGTCRGETHQGSELAYSAMSAPEVGEESVGVRIESDGATLLQNFALVGPTIIATGGGGLVEADADQVAALLESQVDRYSSAAAG